MDKTMIKEFTFNLEKEEILFADVIDSEDLNIIILCKSGNIYLFNCVTNSFQFLGQQSFINEKVQSSPFSAQDSFCIFGFQNWVCIVQSFGVYGTVIDINNPEYKKHLERGNYCAEVSLFPIAFYACEGKTFLIHGTDWNRLDITCL